MKIMKNIKFILLGVINLFAVNACVDDRTDLVINLDNPTPANIITPANGSSYEITLATAANEFDSLTWSEADFTAQVPINYTIQFARKNTNFSPILNLATVGTLKYKINNAELNLALYDFGIKDGTLTELEYRVLSKVNNTYIDTNLYSPVVDINIKPFVYNKPNVTNPLANTTFVLEKDTTGLVDFEEIIIWDAVNYGGTIAGNYTLELDHPDSNFVDPVVLFTGVNNSATIKVSALNKAILKRGFKPEVNANVQFRVTSAVEETKGIVVSDILTLKITPYSDEVGPVEYPKLYVPGDYQGWSPSTAPNIWSINNDGKYTGYVYYPEKSGATYEFKFTSDPDWDHINYGKGGDGILSTNNGAGNLKVPGFGCYQLACDINALTWSYTKTDWGIIGTSVPPYDWTTDVNMTWDATAKALTITADLVAGKFKFMANDAWTINLGDNDADWSLEQDGADIILPESGNYTIQLILSGAIPTYTVQKN
jgi:starch-binding outer membrane protein SusE/F